MLEKQIQAKIVKYLKSIGCKVTKTIVNNTSGTADLIVCYRGYYVEMEVKQPGKHATKLQQLKGRETEEAGGRWFEVHSVDEAMEAIDLMNKAYGLQEDV